MQKYLDRVDFLYEYSFILRDYVAHKFTFITLFDKLAPVSSTLGISLDMQRCKMTTWLEFNENIKLANCLEQQDPRNLTRKVCCKIEMLNRFSLSII